jgi:hypothetical protein
VLVEVGVGLVIDGDLWLRSLLMVLVGADERGLRVAYLTLLLASEDLRGHPRCHPIHFDKARLFMRAPRRANSLVLRLRGILGHLYVL